MFSLTRALSSWTTIPSSFIPQKFSFSQKAIASSLTAIGAVGIIYSKKTSPPSFTNLEAIYPDECYQKLNTSQQNKWDMYLEPNEIGVQKVAPHLITGKPGIILSTGTERSFFNLLLRSEREPENSLGLIILDINPKAIAYAHMTILLLRIANNAQDFSVLSGPNRTNQFGALLMTPSEERSFLQSLTEQEIQEKTDLICERILKSELSELAKNFYLSNLTDFAKVYYSVGNEWRLCGGDSIAEEHWKQYDKYFATCEEGQKLSKEQDKILLKKEEWRNMFAKSFENVQYHQNQKQFKILQKHAKSGSIIAICGDLNDLNFLKGKTNVSVLDLSNVDEYVAIDLKSSISHPRVIWTYRDLPHADYNSYDHDPSRDDLTIEERKEFDLLLKELRELNCMPQCRTNLFFTRTSDNLEVPASRPFGYFRKNLETLRAYKKQWMIDLPHVGTVSFGHRVSSYGESYERMNSRWLYKQSISNLEDIAQVPEIQRFASQLAKLWKEPDLGEKYFIFSKLPGWREAFIEEREKYEETSEWKVWKEKNRNYFPGL
ncbi:MAG TPA: hypothetical protein VLE96_01160 [Chlamydiales bacterium]|nr:hypothetical protein [Chlamydiales bacterium]